MFYAPNKRGGQTRPRPRQRTATKVPSPLLRKARMIAAYKGMPLDEYIETILRPVIERDYEQMFADDPDA
jgi:hypothetical protein